MSLVGILQVNINQFFDHFSAQPFVNIRQVNSRPNNCLRALDFTFFQLDIFLNTHTPPNDLDALDAGYNPETNSLVQLMCPLFFTDTFAGRPYNHRGCGECFVIYCAHPCGCVCCQV